MTRHGLLWLGVAAVALQVGCAVTRPPYPRDEDRARMRSVGVVAIRLQPEVDLRDFPVGKGEMAAKGAAAGAAVGLAASAAGLIACVTVVATCPAVAAVVSGTTVIGATAGAVAGDPAERIEAARADIRASLARANIQEMLASRVVEQARASSIPGVAAVSRASSVSFEEQPSHAPVPGRDVDFLMEVALLKFTMRSTGVIDVRFTLEMTARARLVRVSDGKVVLDHTYFHTSETRRLAEWAENEGQLVRQALNTALAALAEYITEETLLLADASLPPPASGRARPSRFQVTLYPEYPEARGYILGAHITFSVLGFTVVDTLQPTLRWENFFEGGGDRAGVAAGRAAPTYELRLFKAQSVETFMLDTGLILPTTGHVRRWVPGEMVVNRRGITTPYFMLESLLAPCTRYFWTVRARWEQNGRPTATEWAGSYGNPPLRMLPWDLRRVPEGLNYYYGLRNSPRSYYLPFMTPCP